MARLAVALAAAGLASACARSAGEAAMNDLLGTWRKLSAERCAATYPANLVFLGNGNYRGQSDPPGEYAVWDVGTWRAPEPGVLALSTANDAVVDYRFVLDGDGLVIDDPAGCRIRYQRTRE